MSAQVRSFRNVALWEQNLKAAFPELHSKVQSELQQLPDGRVHLNLDALDQLTRDEISASLTVISKMVPPGSIEENEAINRAQIQLGKVQGDKNAAIARLEEYGTMRRLLPSDNNIQLITNYINTQKAGYWSSANIDAAVEALSGRLDYAPPPPPPPAPKPLLDGSQPLPLGTTPHRHHTVAQLRDLDQRERAGRGRQAGTFASKF